MDRRTSSASVLDSDSRGHYPIFFAGASSSDSRAEESVPGKDGSIFDIQHHYIELESDPWHWIDLSFDEFTFILMNLLEIFEHMRPPQSP